jgi:hypothetical protein
MRAHQTVAPENDGRAEMSGDEMALNNAAHRRSLPNPLLNATPIRSGKKDAQC